MKYRKSLKDKLSKFIVDDNDCWLWTGALRGGYGAVKHDGRTQGAHVLSYRIHKGEFDDDLIICHRCDVRSCINPEHLYAGSHRDNALDAVRVGSMYKPYGEAQHGRAFMYQKRKCRCDKCKEWKRASNRRYLDKNKSRDE